MNMVVVVVVVVVVSRMDDGRLEGSFNLWASA